MSVQTEHVQLPCCSAASAAAATASSGTQFRCCACTQAIATQQQPCSGLSCIAILVMCAVMTLLGFIIRP